MVVVNNPESPGTGTVTVVVVAVTLLALGVRYLLVRMGLDAFGTTNAIAVVVVVLLNTGFVTQALASGRWLVIAFAAAAAWAAYRLRDAAAFKLIVSAATFMLLITPIATWASTLDSSVAEVTQGDVGTFSFARSPDVVVIVTDGYASNPTLEELYDYDNSAFTKDLASVGFVVNDDMSSNYGRTALSIPSFLQGGYLLEGAVVGRATRRAMHDLLSGDNDLARLMESNGYETVYVESGWLGTRCKSSSDICVRGPWPDESLYDIVHRSALRGTPGFEAGMSFARGSLHAMEWMDGQLAPLLANGRPEYVYVHVLAPHPPLFLDSGCELDASPELAGFAVGTPELSINELANRRAAYVEQVQCVNRHLQRAAASVASAGAVGLFFGDHGPDQGGQMYEDGTEWNADQRRERFGILFAVHHPGCDYSDLRTLVNTSRRLISCLSGADIPVLPDRYFELSRSGIEPRVIELEAEA
jgi:hypothetical protein